MVPQLVARGDQVRRFADAATAASTALVHVLLEAPDGDVARGAGVHRLVNDDVARAVGRLEQLLGVAGEPGEADGGRVGTGPLAGR